MTRRWMTQEQIDAHQSRMSGVNIDAVHKIESASIPLPAVAIESRRFQLPFPPSANAYWRHVIVQNKVRVLVSRTARDFRSAVKASVGRVKPLRGELACVLTYCYPDKRRRDLDNLAKQVLDAMQHAGVYEDDSQITDLHLMKMPDRGLPACCEVRIYSINKVAA